MFGNRTMIEKTREFHANDPTERAPANLAGFRAKRTPNHGDGATPTSETGKPDLRRLSRRTRTDADRDSFHAEPESTPPEGRSQRPRRAEIS